MPPCFSSKPRQHITHYILTLTPTLTRTLTHTLTPTLTLIPNPNPSPYPGKSSLMRATTVAALLGNTGLFEPDFSHLSPIYLSCISPLSPLDLPARQHRPLRARREGERRAAVRPTVLPYPYPVALAPP